MESTKQKIKNEFPDLHKKLKKENNIFDKEKRERYIELLEMMINQEITDEEFKELKEEIEEMKKDLIQLSDGIIGEKLAKLEDKRYNHFNNNSKK